MDLLENHIHYAIFFGCMVFSTQALIVENQNQSTWTPGHVKLQVGSLWEPVYHWYIYENKFHNMLAPKADACKHLNMSIILNYVEDGTKYQICVCSQMEYEKYKTFLGFFK